MIIKAKTVNKIYNMFNSGSLVSLASSWSLFLNSSYFYFAVLQEASAENV